MNYRHAFHAGGFADVIKHIVLVRILLYLQEKPAAFRVIDTHAGAGVYDLRSDEAARGAEWLTGIARVMQAQFSDAGLPLVKSYLDIVTAFNPQGGIGAYPGSPLIARALLRPQDRLTACELEAGTRKHLIDALRRDAQAKVVDLDGWVGLLAFVPPHHRLEQMGREADFRCRVDQGAQVLGEAGPTEPDAGIDEIEADAGIGADAAPDLLDVGPQPIGQIGHLVHEADLGGQHGVRRVFGQLGASHIHHDHLLMIAIERGVELAQRFF